MSWWQLLGLGLAATLLAMILTNHVLTRRERRHVREYGASVAVGGRQIRYTSAGHGDTTIVLLPGYGTSAPILDFAPLVDELAESYRVIAVEPFGYGLSDGTSRTRTIENIVDEVALCVEELGISKYVLMVHSIWGVYSLVYAKKYRHRLTAIIGLDPAVPSQLRHMRFVPIGILLLVLRVIGIVRIMTKVSPGLVVPQNVEAYSDDQRTQLRFILLRRYSNLTVVKEELRIRRNFAGTQDLGYPEDLPLLHILATDTSERFGAWWLDEHERQIEGLDRSLVELRTVDGPHYLHWKAPSELAALTEDFLNRHSVNRHDA